MSLSGAIRPHGLQEDLQFAGTHLLVSLFAFNVGIELGQLAALAVLVPALALVTRHLLPGRVGRPSATTPSRANRRMTRRRAARRRIDEPAQADVRSLRTNAGSTGLGYGGQRP